MKQTLRELGIGLAVVLVAGAVMAWLTMGPEIKAAVNREAQARQWGPVFDLHDPADDYVTWSYTFKPEGAAAMADTQIVGGYDFSCTMGVYNQDKSPLMTSAALKAIALLVDVTSFHIEDMTTVGGWPPGTVPPGKVAGTDGFVFAAWWLDACNGLGCPDIEANRHGPGVLWQWVSADNNWQWELDIVLTATGFHIDSTRQATVFMGSDTGPTHSNEMTATDVWEADAACGTVTWDFGGMGSNKPNCGACTGIGVSPATNIVFDATMHKSVAGTTVYGRYKNICVNGVPLQLDALEDKWDTPGIYTVGR